MTGIPELCAKCGHPACDGTMHWSGRPIYSGTYEEDNTAVSDTLRSALSAEEWTTGALSERESMSAYLDGTEGFRLVTSNNESGSAAIFEPSELPGLIALANAALPEGSPHRITRADVTMLREAADNDHAAYEHYDRLTALADKLAAFLPPSNERRLS